MFRKLKVTVKNIILQVLLNNLLLLSQWNLQLSSTNAELFDVYFINEDTGFVTGRDGKVLKTTNSGTDWTQSSINPYFNISQVYFVNDLTGYLACEYDYNPLFLYYIYKTTNTGMSWIADYSTSGHRTAGLTFNNPNTGYFASTRCDSAKGTNIYRKTLSSWQLVAGVDSCGLNSMKFRGSVGYWAGSTGGLIFKSTNSGLNWTQLNIGITEAMYDLHVFSADTVIAVGASGKILRTTNGGLNWTPANSGTSLDLVKMSFPTSTTGFISSSGHVYLKTTNGGVSWGAFNTGFFYNSRSVHFINALTGYLVGTNGSILKTTNGGEPIGIKVISNNVPERYELLQNYPNPFNPITHFGFRISAFGLVNICIFDARGREVITLINQKLHAGTYEVDWDAKGLASGLYFYQLAVSSEQLTVFKETKKMVLVR